MTSAFRQLPPTEELARLQQAFRRKRVVALSSLAGGLALFYLLDAVGGTRHSRFFVVGLIAFLAAIGGTVTVWRCPRCGTRLGRIFTVDKCRRCSLPLDD